VRERERERIRCVACSTIRIPHGEVSNSFIGGTYLLYVWLLFLVWWCRARGDAIDRVVVTHTGTDGRVPG
jgi:hypothetical protein